MINVKLQKYGEIRRKGVVSANRRCAKLKIQQRTADGFVCRRRRRTVTNNSIYLWCIGYFFGNKRTEFIFADRTIIMPFGFENLLAGMKVSRSLALVMSKQ